MGKVTKFISRVLGTSARDAVSNLNNVKGIVESQRMEAIAAYAAALAKQKKIFSRVPLKVDSWKSLASLDFGKWVKEGQANVTDDIVKEFATKFDPNYLSNLGVGNPQAVYNMLATHPKLRLAQGVPNPSLIFGNIAHSPFLAKAAREVSYQDALVAKARKQALAGLVSSGVAGGVGYDIYNKNK